MRDLHNNTKIIIKPVDKGGSILIMNTTDYIQEAQRQLLNAEHYKVLTTDPTVTYNKYIHHIIDQAYRLGIINNTTKENLQTKNPRNIYLLHIAQNTQTRQSRKTNSEQYWISNRNKSQHLWMHISDNLHLEYQVM